jgi:hypothetical protein
VFLNRHVLVYSFVRELRDRWRARSAGAAVAAGGGELPLDLNLFRRELSNEWETAWQLTAALLNRFKAETTARSAELFVVTIPTIFQVHAEVWRENFESGAALREIDWDLDEPNRRLAELCVREGIPHLDLLSPLRAEAATTGSMLYFRQDNHWNELGHRAAAALVGPKILELIDRRAATER